jgi:hypothetical protein
MNPLGAPPQVRNAAAWVEHEFDGNPLLCLARRSTT